jgi:hypothetical protein
VVTVKLPVWELQFTAKMVAALVPPATVTECEFPPVTTQVAGTADSATV